MHEERTMIARMIEERKITAEQGLALLEALERSETKPEAAAAEDRVQEDRSPAKETSGMQDGQAYWESKWPAFPTEYAEFKVDNANIQYRAWDQTYTQVHVSAVSRKANGSLDLQRWLEDAIKQSGDDERYKFILLTEEMNKYQIEAQVTISAPEGQSYEMFRLESENGNIDAGQVNAETAFFSTTNGNIGLAGVKAETVQSTTVNGNLSVNGMLAESAHLKTTNGEISVNGRCETLACQTTNGNIRLDDVAAELITSTTLNGNIHANSRYEELSCRTQNGFIAIQIQEGGECGVTADTHNGTIDIKIPEQAEGVYGELSTFSGTATCILNGKWLVNKQADGQVQSAFFRQDDEERLRLKATSVNGSITVTNG
ncbi:DUF4097 family beta strand repeat-containing protein [Paenibacillus montanisoli]|uniref:Uncharacterized protein n=1 Tax=Paenibacillus montanisoli TaxID=2081970 RepID=A0A328TWX5_9BACL|nr:DUF4097 family beta strand repeat-containing protein [Paenibacillus montanisoli]RAP74073.1 hypothetical protein DL346_23660 [Paenibacillus montanisoli]